MYRTLQKTSQKRTPILKGFSLGEVLLAAFVLTAGLLSVTALMASSLRNSFETRDAIIATGLAQEGIELVRNVRDNDLVAGGDGFTLLQSDKHCYFDYNDPASNLSTNCSAAQGAASKYYLQYSGGLYSHISTDPTRFSREIFIKYTSAPEKSVVVRSFAYWDPANFRPANNGSSANCTVLNKCVFTEVTLTAWK